MDRLNFKTWLYLRIVGAEIENNKEYTYEFVNDKKVYIFDSFLEYISYFKKYLKYVDEKVMSLLIYKQCENGKIIVLKSVCDQTIMKLKSKEFYDDLTIEKIDKIHESGKLSPIDAVKIWEQFDLCVQPIKKISLDALDSTNNYRCKIFGYDCHECLLESASHKLEHDSINVELSNSISYNHVLTKK